ncbi:MAG: glycoside hydrolase family 3 N-terminal domain-containing protein [Myxococcota bacterium]
MSMAIGETTSLADRKRRAGQRLLVGFTGLTAHDDLRKRIALLQPAGFLFFGHNIAEVEQVHDLGAELRSLVDAHRPPILAIDQEGGRVQRLTALGAEWPPMATLGRVPHHTPDVARAIARQLRALGFHLNFAPVAELLAGDQSPIGDRAFGRHPARVAEAVGAFIRAHQAQGVMACAKHFPGHGDSDVDSHRALPVRTGDPNQWADAALRPFAAAVEAEVAFVMTAHVLLQDVDAELPVTFSSRVVPQWLRRRLNYDGAVCSDDLVMSAVRDRMSIEEQVYRLSEATVDLFVVGKEPERQVALFEALVRAQERSRSVEVACIRSEARIHALRERFWLPPLGGQAPVDPSILTDPSNRALVAAMRLDDPLA